MRAGGRGGGENSEKRQRGWGMNAVKRARRKDLKGQ